MIQVFIDAPAKVNLGLDVVSRRPDGYHEVRMVMQTIRLTDRIYLRKAESGVTLSCSDPALPSDPSNLAWKAVLAMEKAAGRTLPVEIRIEKRIPMAAGLAGGSTDAAAVLDGLNRLYDLGFSPERLREIGLSLGADIPFCLLRGTALAEGIGEVLTPLRPLPILPMVLAKPPVDVSTKEIYQALTLDEETPHPPIDRMVSRIEAGDMPSLRPLHGNLLETVTIPLCPEIETLREALAASGAVIARMSGSGPTVFGLFLKPEEAAEAYRRLRRSFPDTTVLLTETWAG